MDPLIIYVSLNKDTVIDVPSPSDDADSMIKIINGPIYGNEKDAKSLNLDNAIGTLCISQTLYKNIKNVNNNNNNNYIVFNYTFFLMIARIHQLIL
jgi:hypothetical protein